MSSLFGGLGPTIDKNAVKNRMAVPACPTFILLFKFSKFFISVKVSFDLEIFLMDIFL